MIKICTDKYLQTPALRIKAAKSSIQENPNNAPSGNFHHPLSMAIETGKKWANGRTITCYFMEGSSVQKYKVEREAHKWEKYANLKFSFVKDKNADVRIAFRPNDGSWSYIGTDANNIPKNEPTMNYGWLLDNTPDEEYQRVVLHEFGHTIGAIHEHQSPDAKIPWDKQAVYNYYMGPPNNWTKDDVDVNIFAKYDSTLTQFSAFDTKSIMLYAIPNELTLGDYSVGWNTDFSEGDKKFANTSYPGGDTIIISNPVGNSEIIPGGAPIVGSLTNNQVGTITMNVGFTQGGKYSFNSYPKSLWISIWSGGKKIKDGKGGLQVRLGPGQYKIRVRHSRGSGVFNLSANKV